MISEDKLVPGARVEWESQAGGFTTKKRGTIVAFVPKRQAIETQTLDSPWALHGVERSHIDRYLILLDAKPRGKVKHYYVPVASVVRKSKLVLPAPSSSPRSELPFQNGPAFDAEDFDRLTRPD